MPMKKSAKKSGSAKGTRKKSAAAKKEKVTAEIGDGTMEGIKLQQEFLKKANKWIFDNTSRALDLFRSFDENGDGFISHDEFRRGMSRLKAPFTVDEVEAVIKMIDVDGSGDLDFDEFKDGLRYKYHEPEKKKKGDGLPPLSLVREPLEPCPHCGVGLWKPRGCPSKFMDLHLKLMEFRERSSHPCHLDFRVCSGITVFSLASLVNKHHGDTTDSITIHRYISKTEEGKGWDDEPLDEALTLEDCGYEGGSRLHPSKATLCYDYLPVVMRCPLLMADPSLDSATTRSSLSRAAQRRELP